MNNQITTYTVVAVAIVMVGLIFLGTDGSSSNSVNAQDYTSNSTGMYCEPQDYLCHDELGKSALDNKSYSQAEYHYDLAAESAIAYPEIAKHYEQLASAIKYGNYTDAEDHYSQVHGYLDEYVSK